MYKNASPASVARTKADRNIKSGQTQELERLRQYVRDLGRDPDSISRADHSAAPARTDPPPLVPSKRHRDEEATGDRLLSTSTRDEAAREDAGLTNRVDEQQYLETYVHSLSSLTTGQLAA